MTSPCRSTLTPHSKDHLQALRGRSTLEEISSINYTPIFVGRSKYTYIHTTCRRREGGADDGIERKGSAPTLKTRPPTNGGSLCGLQPSSALLADLSPPIPLHPGTYRWLKKCEWCATSVFCTRHSGGGRRKWQCLRIVYIPSKLCTNIACTAPPQATLRLSANPPSSSHIGFGLLSCRRSPATASTRGRRGGPCIPYIFGTGTANKHDAQTEHALQRARSRRQCKRVIRRNVLTEDTELVILEATHTYILHKYIKYKAIECRKQHQQ